ncbi:carbonyl reductase (NADPH-dependent) ari1 [Ancistrocladus abbreviatus]
MSSVEEEGLSSEEQEDYYDSGKDSLEGIIDDATDADASKGPGCEVITKESLLAAQRDDLQRIMDVLLVREHHARTLLIHYRWDADKLITVLVEKGKEKLFAEAGITSVEHHDFDSSSPSSMLMCYVCMEDVLGDEATRMDCGHCYCNNCWTEHFIVKINEGQSRRIRCMAHKCNAVCDEAVVRSLVSIRHPDLAEKFDRFLLESYIEDNRMVKWCPSVPHCGNAIRVDDDDLHEVQCTCGLQFCFSCLSEPHSPCSCLMWELWNKKCKDESETVNWITAYTKSCPTCHKPVEKNGGCNIVLCVCGHSFCWVCVQALGYNHGCGRYKEEGKVQNARQYLYRYMHYYNRYKAHTDSLKLETKLQQKIREKVEISEEKDSNLRDFSWLRNGLHRLFRCRQVLSYSYPFAYYMFGDDLFKDEMTIKEREIKKNLFEDQQQQLEDHVEKLSRIIEEPFELYDEDKVMLMRSQVIVLSDITDKLCMKMYECIENELLGSLQFNIQNIAPYKSKGLERASDFSVRWSIQVDNDKCAPSDDRINGQEAETDKPSGSGSSNRRGSSSLKRVDQEVKRMNALISTYRLKCWATHRLSDGHILWSSWCTASGMRWLLNCTYADMLIKNLLLPHPGNPHSLEKPIPSLALIVVSIGQ